MSKLICHAGHRVVVVRAADKTAVVRHWKDGSKCLSKLLFQGKNKYTPDEVLVRGDHFDLKGFLMSTAMDRAIEADLEWRFSVAQCINVNDMVCGQYLVDNRERVLPRVMLKAQKYGGDMAEVVHEFVKGVHERHLSGLPLS